MRSIGGTIEVNEATFRQFSFNDRPLEGIQSNIKFDVKGHDHWIRGYTIEVVDNPAITESTVDFQYPAYIDKLPALDLTWHRGLELPRGGTLTVHCKTNKTLKQVGLYLPEAELEWTIFRKHKL